MRNFIIWTLSVLLVTEPAVWAANRPTINELKAFIEYSEVGQRSMSFKELYGRTMAYLPQDVREQIEPSVIEYGDYQIPKFNITKLKNAKGEEYYQLSAVQDGKAVTLSLGEGEKSLVKINGKVVDSSDMNNWVGVLAKAGLAKNELKNIPAPSVSKRTPAQVNILNSKQIDRLSTEQKRTYFRQLRELLESMEAVDQSILGKGKKSSSREPASMKNFAALFLGEAAVAGDSEQCVAAGHVTTAMYDSVKGRLTCGSDGKGNVQAKLRDGCASNREFRCNTSLYGSGKICVPAGPDSTALCNQKVSANDIPDTYKNDPVEFNAMVAKAKVHIADVSEACGKSVNGSLAADQVVTCEKFNDRRNTIESWTCASPDFKKKYSKLCSGPDQPGSGDGTDPILPLPPGSGGGNAGGGGTDGNGGGAGSGSGGNSNGGDSHGGGSGSGSGSNGNGDGISCANLPLDMDMNLNATCTKGGTGNGTCLDKTGKAIQTSKCYCDNGGHMIAKMTCDGGSGKIADGDGTKDRKKKKSHGPNWLLIFGAGLLGLGAFWWLSKKALKQNYKNIDPLPQATPVPVNVVAPPGAR
jgi:uncharacterized membrane protein YgcG